MAAQARVVDGAGGHAFGAGRLLLPDPSAADAPLVVPRIGLSTQMWSAVGSAAMFKAGSAFAIERSTRSSAVHADSAA